MESENNLHHQFLASCGMQRNILKVVVPDVIIIGSDPTSIVHPFLYNKPLEPVHVHRVDKVKDYNALSLITSAKLENIALLGVGRGSNLLHVSNGGSLTLNFNAKIVNSTHSLSDSKGNNIKDSEVSPSYDLQGIELEDIQSLNLYDESIIINGEEKIVETFFCKSRRQVGMRFPISNTCNKKLFEEEILEIIKEFL
jgi:gamma-glutamyl-gamma-aminobutyrate hydrolase PuuD